MAERLRSYRLNNGQTVEVSNDIYHEITRDEDRIKKRIRRGNPIEIASSIDIDVNDNDTNAGSSPINEILEDTYVGCNPAHEVERKQLIQFVHDYLEYTEMITICRLSIMEDLPDKVVMKKFGITKQSTFSYKKQKVLKRLSELEHIIPEYRSYWPPVPHEYYRPKKQKEDKGENKKNKE